MSRRLVMCYKELSPEKCVQYEDTNYNQALKNRTHEDYDILRLKLEVEGLKWSLFVITEVLAVAILLVFILVLVLTWRIKRNKTKEQRNRGRISQQTFMNRAYQPDDQTDHSVCNMKYSYPKDFKLPMELKY